MNKTRLDPSLPLTDYDHEILASLAESPAITFERRSPRLERSLSKLCALGFVCRGEGNIYSTTWTGSGYYRVWRKRFARIAA